MDLLDKKAYSAFTCWLDKMPASQARHTAPGARDPEVRKPVHKRPGEAVDLFLQLEEGQAFSDRREVLLREAERRAQVTCGVFVVSEDLWNAQQARAAKKQ